MNKVSQTALHLLYSLAREQSLGLDELNGHVKNIHIMISVDVLPLIIVRIIHVGQSQCCARGCETRAKSKTGGNIHAHVRRTRLFLYLMSRVVTYCDAAFLLLPR